MGGRVAKRKPAKAIVDAAQKLEDLSERAAFLERALGRVEESIPIAKELFTTLYASPLGPDSIAEKLIAICRKHSKDTDLLDSIGRDLDNSYREEDAIEVLRIAVAAGTEHEHSLETLGRLLVLRGDASGVPFLERAIALDPNWTDPRIALATWLHDKQPAEALAVLGDLDTARAHELRAMIHEAAGHRSLARASLDEARAHYSNDFVAHKWLADWHTNENRYPRALVHAREMFEEREDHRHPDGYAKDDLDDADTTIVLAFRMGGAFADLVPWLRERVERDGFSYTLAWQTFHGLTSYTPTRELELAIRAAEFAMAYEREKKQHSEVRAWRVRIARERAAAGNIAALEALAHDGLDDDPLAWVELADAYHHIDLHDAAHAAVDRALELDPTSADAMSTLFDLSLSAGDAGALHRWAEALAVARPRWHQGPEHLGRSYARRGDPRAAVFHAQTAVDIAPFCHNAWIGLAEAYIVAGDLERARDATRRSIALEAPDAGDDVSILHAAVEGKPEALDYALARRFKHLPALPFPGFVEKLREAARRATPSS